MIRRKILYIIAFVLVCVLGALMVFLTKNSCDAVNQYIWTNHLSMRIFFFSLIKMMVIFVTGILLFLLVRKKIRHEKFNKIKLIYFAILPLFVFHNQFLIIKENIINRKIVQSLCEKSASNGMMTESKNINIYEYKYLNSECALFPNIPITAGSIDVYYYHDSFLGDFIFEVAFNCDIHEKIDTIDKRWIVSDRDKLADRKHIIFHIDDKKN